jgi:primosomal protein N' (replication factor Y)
MRLAEVVFPVPVDKAFSYEITEALRARVVPGARVRASFGPRRLFGVVARVIEGEPPPKVKPIDAVLDGHPLMSEDGLDLLRWLSRRYCAPPGESLKLMVPKNLREARRPVADLAPLGPEELPEAPPPPPSPFELTASQKGALERLGDLVDKRAFSASLLFGVPASGKTEVYLRLIRRAVRDGGQVLFLVPEISLSKPFYKEFSKALGLPVALWHSKTGAKKRREAWTGLRSGRIRAVVGARSAALLPFRDLRLVVMDEEQDESYKQDDQPPYYHARDVVLERARRRGAAVVLGSATPSIEAFSDAAGESFSVVRMDERVSKTTERPPVRILARRDLDASVLSEELVAQMKDRLQRGEQVILLVNRRGFSNFIICRKCAWVARCPTCEIAFIHHSAPKEQKAATGSLFGGESGFHLRCHHCDATSPVPQNCGRCGGGPLRFAGVGTQKVVAELRRSMPYAKVLRMDRDTVSKEKADEENGVYDAFMAGEADILVGTKLVAKGFHFPKVTLVGVVDADTMLSMPDFRSAERTVQLLIQAAGRAGRADRPGEVILQTAQPEHYAIQAVARGDYAAFAKLEIGHRRELHYPPASTLVRLVFAGKTEKSVIKGSKEAADQLRLALHPDDELVGPAPGVHARLHGQFRHHALLKIRERARLEPMIDAIRGLTIPTTVRVKVNVDPYDFF